MKKHTSSLDILAKLIPSLIAVLGLILVFRLKEAAGASIVVVGGGIAVLIVATYLLRPRAIFIDNNGLTIDRMVKPVKITFADIKLIRALNAEEMKWSLRTFGNGGMFGYTGKYYNRTLGSMTWYVTQRKNYILIEKLDGKKIIITPDHPQDFLLDVQSLNKNIPVG